MLYKTFLSHYNLVFFCFKHDIFLSICQLLSFYFTSFFSEHLSVSKKTSWFENQIFPVRPPVSRVYSLFFKTLL